MGRGCHRNETMYVGGRNIMRVETDQKGCEIIPCDVFLAVDVHLLDKRMNALLIDRLLEELSELIVGKHIALTRVVLKSLSQGLEERRTEELRDVSIHP